MNKINRSILITIAFFLFTPVALGNDYSKPVKSSGDLQDRGTVYDPAFISPDSRSLVYVADQEIDGVYELFKTDLPSGNVIKLNPTLVDEGEVDADLKISSDSRYVVYLARQSNSRREELYSVPINGGESVKLNGTLAPASFNRVADNFLITPDGSHVVYAADESDNGNSKRQLYSVPIAGGEAVQLNTSVNEGILVFSISANGEYVVYLNRRNKTQIFSVSISGGEAVELNPDLASNRNVRDFQILPDSNFVVYASDQLVDNKFELFLVSIVGGEVSKLNPDMGDDRDVREYALSADGRYLIYKANIDEQAIKEIYSIDLQQPVLTSIKLLDSIVPSGEVTNFQITDNSESVVFVADKDSLDSPQLYRVPIAGGANSKLNLELSSGNEINYFYLSRDSRYAVFNDNREIYSANLNTGSVVKLNFDLGMTDPVIDFSITPDSKRVIYLADKDGNGDAEIYSVRIKGGASESLIGGDPIEGVYNEYFWISEDSQHVVYLSNLFDQTKEELYTVSLVDDELCVPIKTVTGAVAVICL